MGSGGGSENGGRAPVPRLRSAGMGEDGKPLQDPARDLAGIGAWSRR